MQGADHIHRSILDGRVQENQICMDQIELLFKPHSRLEVCNLLPSQAIRLTALEKR